LTVDFLLVLRIHIFMFGLHTSSTC